MKKNESYEQLIEWLFHQFPAFQKVGEKAYKPTLENTQSLIDLFKLDLTNQNFVHVAGTNGKGTTCSIIASVLKEANYKTGLFTSPHIHDFRERIRVNGEMISEEEITDFILEIKEAQLQFSPSFFEITWVLALKHYIESGCDIIIVETGMGGRLDATNIIKPLISIITNIGLDHTKILGDTRSLIAAEKAGIIKENVPVLIGEKDDETKDVFITRAKDKNTQLEFVTSENVSSVFEINKKLAFAALRKLKDQGWEIGDKHFTDGINHLISNTGLTGRLQVLKKSPLIIADAAHNKEGIASLITFVKKEYPDRKISVIYGASNDKDLVQIFQLFPSDWFYYLAEFKNERSCTAKMLSKNAEDTSIKFKTFNSAKKAFESAQNSMNKEDILIVFGSFFLLEEII